MVKSIRLYKKDPAGPLWRDGFLTGVLSQAPRAEITRRIVMFQLRNDNMFYFSFKHRSVFKV